MIEVQQVSGDDPLEFEVTIGNGLSTRHRVSMSRADHERLAGESVTPEACVTAAFRFLLDREPKEAILQRFDITVINRYFPEFERKLPDYLAKG